MVRRLSTMRRAPIALRAAAVVTFAAAAQAGGCFATAFCTPAFALSPSMRARRFPVFPSNGSTARGGDARIASSSSRSAFSSLSSSIDSTDFLAYPLTQVLSDVDDTLKSSGGVTVAGVSLGGIDVQYERGDFYPGVFQFMWELSAHSVTKNERYAEERRLSGKGKKNPGAATAAPLVPPKAAILTARAEEFKAALEIKEGSKLAEAFRRTGEAAGVSGWGVGPVLYGSVSEWIVQFRKGLRKFNNFERLLEQDPTGRIMQYIYVGDTGELDQEAGETMLREYPEVVQAVFLHVVYDTPPDASQSTPPSIPPPKLINGRPLVFFRTYVGAAAKATQLGLMGGDGLMLVVDEAEKALEGVERSSDKWTDLERDIEEAYRTLGVVLR